MPYELAISLIKQHEGFNPKPYKCPAGFLTIGWGHNLDANGLSTDICEAILQADVDEAVLICEKLIANFHSLTDARKAVLIDMAFNLGENRFAKFLNMRRAIENSNWEQAAKAMEDSLWYQQVKTRAERLTEMMRRG